MEKITQTIKNCQVILTRESAFEYKFLEQVRGPWSVY